MQNSARQSQIATARHLADSGEMIRAELCYLDILKAHPDDVEALVDTAELAVRRDDFDRAIQLLRAALQIDPLAEAVAMRCAELLVVKDDLRQAIGVLIDLVQRKPDCHHAWLMVGWLKDARGDVPGALRAWYQAITRAQKALQWRDSDSTPEHLLLLVTGAVDRLRASRRELFLGSYERLRSEVGVEQLTRVDRAVAAYLGEWEAVPESRRQQPKFFFFPDLPQGPYHDPHLHAWASRLQDEFPKIRSEAQRVWGEDQGFPNFLEFKEGENQSVYLQGAGPKPAWEAFFFYRHGKRYDANHERCPNTSRVLESIQLCRIQDQAPEICFSVLAPGSHIMPHYGVTNTRLVMHLPLIVPANCALNVVGLGEHAWREGELMMFDDTFQHEAWNHSKESRIVLLMDCWNPHLTENERIAVKHLFESITDLQQVERAWALQ